MLPEPNGSCPLGRENKTNIVAQRHEISEVKTRLHEVEDDVQELIVRMERTTVKVAIIIGVIVGVFSAFGQPIVSAMINGGS